ncbi:hypothetical protein L13192_02381 [Pyrenophora tritici-repentis]|nr:hypothetical protein L13192_02381 [Pyrenophora tritici-repentis]
MTGTKRKHSFLETTPVETTVVSASSSWSELPTELKLNVLGYVLVFDRPITPHVHLMHSMYHLLPLALTNKKMCILAMELYYTKNHFVVQVVRNLNPMFRLSYPNPMVGHWIQNLTLKLNFLSYDNGGFGQRNISSRSGQWKFLLNGFDPDEKCALSAEWYNKLSLKNLKVILYLNDKTCFMKGRLKNLPLDHCRRIARLGFECTSIATKAKNYTFEVTGIQCMTQNGSSFCHGACSKIIVDVLGDMVPTE